MEVLQYAVDLFLHLDKHLAGVVQTYGTWTYAILFVIIFCETGLVVTPFLPGDSLLFAAGAIAGLGGLSLGWLLALLTFAGILGDTVNYAIGKFFGRQLLARHSRWFRPEHLERTHAFFDRYGGATIIVARFVPIVRTFAPFVAGMGAMNYAQFVFYNVVGAILWVVLCTLAGYLFGQHPFVQRHFSLVILAIIIISILPGVVTYLLQRSRSAPTAAARAEREGA